MPLSPSRPCQSARNHGSATKSSQGSPACAVSTASPLEVLIVTPRIAIAITKPSKPASATTRLLPPPSTRTAARALFRPSERLEHVTLAAGLDAIARRSAADADRGASGQRDVVFYLHGSLRYFRAQRCWGFFLCTVSVLARPGRGAVSGSTKPDTERARSARKRRAPLLIVSCRRSLARPARRPARPSALRRWRFGVEQQHAACPSAVHLPPANGTLFEGLLGTSADARRGRSGAAIRPRARRTIAQVVHEFAFLPVKAPLAECTYGNGRWAKYSAFAE